MNNSKLIDNMKWIAGIFFVFFLIITGITIIPILENLGASKVTLFFYSISIVCAALWVIFFTIESLYISNDNNKYN